MSTQKYAPCICGVTDYYGDHDHSKDVWDPAPPACPFCGKPGKQTDYFGHPFFYFTCEPCGEFEGGFTHEKWWRDTGDERVEGIMPDPAPTRVVNWRLQVWGPWDVQGDWDHSEVVCVTAYSSLSKPWNKESPMPTVTRRAGRRRMRRIRPLQVRSQST